MKTATKAAPDTVLAMDLGTSNTCLVRCAGGREQLLRPRDCCNAAVAGSVPTLVLYDGAQPAAIGAQAETEYGEASPREREQYRLCALFKPDVAVREEARREMTDFLRLLRAVTDVPDKVLVGIPSEAGNLYREHLRACLQEAGWGQARFLSEPLGAVIHYLVKGALPPSQAARGVLTVDFGGGTCDFALLRRAAVTARSGDVLLGGRLFDDVFWQLLTERNAGLEAELEREGNSYYVHWLACRQAKEEFSRAMHRDRKGAVTLRVRWSVWDGHTARERSVYIEQLGWQEFLLRAGAYVASPALRQLLCGHENAGGLSAQGRDLLQGRPVDLVQWFENALRHSLPAGEGEGVPTVLLTGGSSAWPFVEDVVRQQLGPDAVILMGDEPYADIARGLARYYQFSTQLRRGRAALEESLPYFLEQRLPSALRRVMSEAAEDILESCTEFLREAVIVPCCVRYRSVGGSLRDLRENMGDALDAQSAALARVLGSTADGLGQDMETACRAALKQWFQEKGIPILPERLRRISPGGTEEVLHRIRQELGSAALAPLRERLTNAVVTILAGVMGLGVFTAGMVALPVAVAVAGLGGVAMKYSGAGRKMVDGMQEWRLPSLIRSSLSDARIAALADEQLREFRATLRDGLLEAWASAEMRMVEETGRAAREEIAALDILHVTPA